MQNGCPCFGTLSALMCALKVALLGFPKNAFRKSRKLTCFASHKYAEIDPPFLTPKKGVSRWILTVKICKPREYMGPKMAGQPCAQKRSSQRAVSCAMDLQSGREAPTKWPFSERTVTRFAPPNGAPEPWKIATQNEPRWAQMFPILFPALGGGRVNTIMMKGTVTD